MNSYINIHCIIDNFQFLLAYLILCILVTYIIPWSYPIPFIDFYNLQQGRFCASMN